MNKSSQLVVFSLDGKKFALYLDSVETVVRAVEITPLPQAPDIVLGIVNFRGRVIPVVNIRKRFGLPARDLELSDQLIVAATARRAVALVADRVGAVIEIADREIVRPEQVLPGTGYIDGVVKIAGDLLLIHDLESFLSLDEESSLSAAMSEGVRH